LRRSLYEKIKMSRVHYGQDCHLGTDKRQGAVPLDLTLRSIQNIIPWYLRHCPSKVQSSGWSVIWSISPYQSCSLLISQLVLISKKESSSLFNDWLWIHADSLISNDSMSWEEGWLVDLLLSWHLILVSVRKSKAMVGSGCPVPLKLERCFYMNLQPIFPMLCASSDDQETCNQKTFQTFFNCIKQVCRMRKGLASKYLEDWLLLFHSNLLRAKRWSVYYHPVMESPSVHWNMNECVPRAC